MLVQKSFPLRGERGSIQPTQLRRLQILWRRWTGKLHLTAEADRQLRHYYIWVLTKGRATETLELSQADAALVIGRLARWTRREQAPQDYAAGTAGREGYPEQRRVPPSRLGWVTLWNCAAALGMERSDVDRFIRAHYAGAGLGGLADIQTMADLNRVLWGLKAMLRRREQPQHCADEGQNAA